MDTARHSDLSGTGDAERPLTVERLDAPAVNKAKVGQLYASREPIYPKRVSGRFRNIKTMAMIGMLSIYYGLPWVRWDRGPGVPDQAVLVDFPGRRFYFFFIELWPQEVYYITGLLVLGAVGLFLATSMFGRLWCGFACPQTVWTDLFLAVERRVEGDRNKRMKLDKAPWSLEKITRKTVKHAIWLLIAAGTGGAWIIYFHDAPDLFRTFFAGVAPVTAYAFFGIMTIFTYLLGGFAREQVCIYMCPWPRIQGAMVDENTLMVTYDSARGEPRGPHKKGDSWDGRGHCVSCRQCVAVCPMGIDIRDGLQLECIGCGLCVDACNNVMEKVDLPKYLIGFAPFDTSPSEATLGKLNLIRPRTVIYAVILLAVGSIMLFALLTRTTLELNVQRDRNPLFVQLSDGSVRNGYTLKVLNKERITRSLQLSIASEIPLTMRIGGQEGDGTAPDIEVGPDTLEAVKVFLTVPADVNIGDSWPVTFTLKDETANQTAIYEAVFVGGEK